MKDLVGMYGLDTQCQLYEPVHHYVLRYQLIPLASVLDEKGKVSLYVNSETPSQYSMMMIS